MRHVSFCTSMTTTEYWRSLHSFEFHLLSKQRSFFAYFKNICVVSIGNPFAMRNKKSWLKRYISIMIDAKKITWDWYIGIDRKSPSNGKKKKNSQRNWKLWRDERTKSEWFHISVEYTWKYRSLNKFFVSLSLSLGLALSFQYHVYGYWFDMVWRCENLNFSRIQIEL